MSRLLKSTILLLTIVLSISSHAKLPRDQEGRIYFATLHEKAYYNNNLLYTKNYDKKDWFTDLTLNKIANARYDAIDRKMVTLLTQQFTEFANDKGLKITYKNIHTSGVLTTAFEPSNISNTLDFTISGININAYVKFKKSWLAKGTLRTTVKNITIKGQYNYFNGNVSVQDVNAPVSSNADIDISPFLLGFALDPFLDNYVDKLVVKIFPEDLKDLFNGGDIYSSTIAGIADFIPLNKLVFEGIDYGQVFRDKLEKSSPINDNFSISIGNIVVHNQLFSITVGNVTYKRYTTGGKRYCKLGTPGCDELM